MARFSQSHCALRASRWLLSSAISFSSAVEAFLRGLVLFLAQRLALDLKLHEPAFETFEFFGHRFHLGAQLGGGFVHQVDGLVRQETVGDVAMGKLRGGDERGVLDAHAVVHFVALPQAAQDRDGVFDARLVHHHRLEAAFERGVFLDVLAVFVERGRADAVQFAAREHRLEHVAGVHRALGFARADDGVHFVDEENDLALGALVISWSTALRRSSNSPRYFAPAMSAPEIQAIRRLSLRLSGTSPATMRRASPSTMAVLPTPGSPMSTGLFFVRREKHLNAAADFLVAADDRIELVLLRQLREVAPVFFERLVSGLGIGAGDALVAAHLRERLEKLVAADVERLENLADAGGGRLVEHGQHQVFDADVFVLEFLRFVLRFDQELVQALSDVEALAGGGVAGNTRDAVEFLFDLGLEQVGCDFCLFEQARHKSAFLFEQREHEVLDIDRLMLVARGDVLRLRQRSLGFFGEFVQVHTVNHLTSALPNVYYDHIATSQSLEAGKSSEKRFETARRRNAQGWRATPL